MERFLTNYTPKAKKAKLTDAERKQKDTKRYKNYELQSRHRAFVPEWKMGRPWLEYVPYQDSTSVTDTSEQPEGAGSTSEQPQGEGSTSKQPEGAGSGYMLCNTCRDVYLDSNGELTGKCNQ